MIIRRALALLSSLTMAGGAAVLPATAASAATPAMVHPNSCQAASATLTLETTARGYTYDCTGLYFLPSGTIAYALYTNGWSGWIRTFSGSTEYDIDFCNNQSWSIPYNNVLDIYLSPTKEPWC